MNKLRQTSIKTSGHAAHHDFVIIGGGIVGAATAWQLKQRHPDKSILLLEKEADFATQQSGHNSGVIHAGIYYEPGSLKARFCKEGLEATLRFCRKYDIPCEQCGKLLVASNELELTRLQALAGRATENGLEFEQLDAKALSLREPAIVGEGAIFLKSTGIVDFRKVCLKMIDLFQQLGGDCRLNAEVTDLSETRDGICVLTRDGGSHEAGYVIACSGLSADRTAKMLGLPINFQIIPFRGEYFKLATRQRQVIKHLIYPVPDPQLPFLGIHLTRLIDGSVIVGPNAVQGWKREGYGAFNISFRDCWDMFRFPGYWRATFAHLSAGLKELWHAWWKPGYLKQVQKYCPGIELRDLQPHPAGIRAQAVMRDGQLVHDFLFAESPRSLHVCNAPSPAATSAIPIGQYICEQVESRWQQLDGN